ncbi:MAG TPA: type III-A CRISPR-associated RAMP protein Csm3 [Acetivibrio clariflavus]|nr:type III-A CRISPR-associated RAMP protein Csm3 [Acetivibrio clariflavus]
MKRMPSLKTKIKISGLLTLVTGLHIGRSGDFTPIGAVDSIVVRDPIKREPIIPGSSLKGKMRTLLAKVKSDKPWNIEIEEEDPVMHRLFGYSKKDVIIPARLQFSDLFMNKDSVEELKRADTDLYLTEIKFENTISRATCVANPRQIERVPAGAVFDFELYYNVENEDEVIEDFEKIGMTMKLLSLDYLGGGGSRGNGRIEFKDIDVQEMLGYEGIETNKLKEVLANALSI